MAEDIVERLRECASLRSDDFIPKWLDDDDGNWAGQMTALLNEAIVEIERLRATQKGKK